MPAVDIMQSIPAVSAKETTKSIGVLEELIKNLTISKSQDEANTAAGNVASLLHGPIEEQSLPSRAVDSLKKQLSNKKDALARERALNGITAIAAHSAVSPAFEPYLISLLAPTLAAVGDKMTTVKTAAQSAAVAIARSINPNAVKSALPAILKSVESAQKWPEKIAALDCIDAMVETAPAQLAYRVPDLIPVISAAMWDTKPEIKKKAYGTMEKLCKLIENKDI
jgi:elongation factor 3